MKLVSKITPDQSVKQRTEELPRETQDLIAGFLDGEDEAIRIIDGWICRAASPFRRSLGSQWESAVQDARLEVTQLLQRGEFRGASTLKTYLWRVVNHTCLDWTRKQMKWRWVDLETLVERYRTPQDSPLAHLLRQEAEEMLLRVLEETGTECRELWSMILAGLSYETMGQRLDVAPGTLRVRVLRCRKKAVALRDKLSAAPQGALT